MTEQEKKILFQAICESLSYGLKCTTKAQGWPGVYSICGCIGNKIILDCPKEVEGDDIWLVQNIIPYLRPMSSMTEDEKIELKEYLDAEEVDCNGFGYIEGGTLEDYVSRISYSLCNYVINWLKSKHFDYRGLIPMGLALPAPEGMYK